MLMKLLIIAGILLINLSPLSFLNKPLEIEIAGTNKDEQEPVTQQELNRSRLILVKEKLNEKYVGVDVKTTSKKELVIQVVGDEEYVNSVKNDMESIAKSVIKSTPLKGYTVHFERWDLFKILEEMTTDQQELHLIGETVMEGLKEYDLIGDIGTHYQKSITIRTAIKGSNKDARKVAIEIEETVNAILHSKELKSIPHIDSYEIKVLNSNGKVLN